MTPALPPLEITCRDVQRLLERGDDVLLVDCREPDEHKLVSLAGAMLLPLKELPQRVGELAPHRERCIVVHCHHGGRSARAAAWLRQQGFDARSLEGGIDRWALEIDPTLPRY